MTKYVRLLCFIAGGILLGLNAYGLVTPHHYAAPELAEVSGETPPARYNAAIQRLRKARSLGFHEKVSEVTYAVHDGVIHYWPGKKVRDTYLRVSLSKNYLLYILSYADPLLEQVGQSANKFTHYQYQDSSDILERGVGLCDMQARVVAETLRDMNVKAGIALLNGHVIAWATSKEGETWLLDPDYGVIIPHSLTFAETHPAKLAEYYGIEYDANSPEPHLISLYTSASDNEIIGGGNEFTPRLYRIEKAANILKWVLPLVLLALGVVLRQRKV